jgi:nitrate reductase gamma subunit
VNLDLMLFTVAPYLALVVFVIGTAYRLVVTPSTVSSRSSQLLEGRKLFWGSISFHAGLLLVMAGHLLALLVPRGVELWNGAPLRLYLLEITGFALGLWALAGLGILVWRRLSEPRIQVVTDRMDVVVLALLAVSLVTGLLTAVTHSFGSYWFTSVMTPYFWSLAALSPRPELLADLPWLIKLHVSTFFVLLAIVPFSRLVHVPTVPLGYLVRPWLLVVHQRRSESALQEAPQRVSTRREAAS